MATPNTERWVVYEEQNRYETVRGEIRRRVSRLLVGEFFSESDALKRIEKLQRHGKRGHISTL